MDSPGPPVPSRPCQGVRACPQGWDGPSARPHFPQPRRLNKHASRPSVRSTMERPTQVAGFDPIAGNRFWVIGDNLSGLLADELPPGGLAAARSGRDALAAQDPGHLHVGDAKPELERLALDAPVPPARILSGEPQNQRPPLRIAGRTLPGRALAKGRPLTADQITVP